jgi:hypothetical protein
VQAGSYPSRGVNAFAAARKSALAFAAASRFCERDLIGGPSLLSKRYNLGDATLYAGDCLDVLPKLELFDAIVTDPPYDLLSVSRAGSARRNDPATPVPQTAAAL